MMRLRARWSVCLVGWLMSWSIPLAQIMPEADLQTADGRGQERARLQLKRTELSQQFDGQEKMCQSKFVVSSCLEEVKRQRALEMKQLKYQERVLDDMERKQRSAEQQRSLDEKATGSVQPRHKEVKQPKVPKDAKAAMVNPQPLAGEASTQKKEPDAKESSTKALETRQREQEKQAAYDAKQQELAQRIRRRDEGLLKQNEKIKAHERERADKAQKSIRSEAATKD